MNYVETIILSMVQGIAEWLPVSSEGLSVLVMLNLFGQNISQAITYAFFLHLGTALAVLIRFRREFIHMLQGSQLLKIVIITTASTALIAVPLVSFIEMQVQNGRLMNLFIGFLLILTGVMLRIPGSGYKTTEQMSVTDMVLLGLAQGLAVLPGISRSGTTISFLMLRKMSEEQALKLSFIISVPAVLGAIAFRGPPSDLNITTGVLILVITCIFGYLTMEALLRFARKVDFSKFCITFGAIAIVLTALTF
ncbi:MAG: undecaprenyl-diphosphate phosphatase [Archaeoglobaceae archaeon]